MTQIFLGLHSVKLSEKCISALLALNGRRQIRQLRSGYPTAANIEELKLTSVAKKKASLQSGTATVQIRSNAISPEAKAMYSMLKVNTDSLSNPIGSVREKFDKYVFIGFL